MLVIISVIVGVLWWLLCMNICGSMLLVVMVWVNLFISSV